MEEQPNLFDILGQFNGVGDFFNFVTNWFVGQLAGNEFLVGILIPGLLGGLIVVGRQLFNLLKHYSKLALTSEITITTDNQHYDTVSQYLYKTSISKMFQRFFTLTSDYNTDEDITITVGYGTSIGFINGWPVLINRSREDTTSKNFKEIIKITIYGGRHSVINKLINEVKVKIEEVEESNFIKVYLPDSDDWMIPSINKPKRSMDTIIIPDEQKKYLLDKVNTFINSEKEYIRKGIPYHLGIMLDGLPGTGKTSIIHALASEINRSISYQNKPKLVTSGINPTETIFVIEDIDTNGMNVQRRDSEDNQDPTISALKEGSMATILNTLDGMMSPHGMIIVATTNHFDQLDPAITRPGRFDIRLTLDYMKYPEWIKMCKLFERENNIPEERYHEISPSQARYMMLFYNDAEIIKWFEENK